MSLQVDLQETLRSFYSFFRSGGCMAQRCQVFHDVRLPQLCGRDQWSVAFVVPRHDVHTRLVEEELHYLHVTGLTRQM